MLPLSSIRMLKCSIVRRFCFNTSQSGLKYKDLIVGTGKQPLDGEIVSVHYCGKLEDGFEFDSSYKRGVPIEFPLSEGRVIAGWDEGISTMRVGGKRLLNIPPHLGYGYRSMGSIPSGSTLIFECELVGIGPAKISIFRQLWNKLQGK